MVVERSHEFLHAFDKSQFVRVLCTSRIFDSGYLWQTLRKICTGNLNFSDGIAGSTLVHGWFTRGYPNRRSARKFFAIGGFCQFSDM